MMHLRAATAPLPEITDATPALMRVADYLKARNPEGITHPSEVYDVDVDALNEVHPVGSGAYGDLTFVEYSASVLIKKNDTLVGVSDGTKLYHNNGLTPSNLRSLPKIVNRSPLGQQLVPTKYPNDIATKLLQRKRDMSGPIQRFRLKGAQFTLHTTDTTGITPKPRQAPTLPPRNRGHTILILNDQGLVVAVASDEWGATLLRVAREYRGYGLGSVLGKFWYEMNPYYQSGGYTPQGKVNAVRLWENEVLEWLTNGWYSQAIREQYATKNQVQDILSDLSPRGKQNARRLLTSLRDTTAPASPQKARLLFYVDDPTSPITFVVYDEAFLTSRDDKHIYGYGFFSDTPRSPAPFLYTIDWERPYATLVMMFAFAAAEKAGHGIYIGEGGDMLDLSKLPNVKVDADGVATLDQSFPFDEAVRLERLQRHKADPYRELEATLVDQAESKDW